MQIQQAPRISQSTHTTAVELQPSQPQESAPSLVATLGGVSGPQLEIVSHAPLAASAKSDVICEGCGPRQVTITRKQDGSASVTLARPPITSLVLSGGGAKGGSYPGCVRELEAQGKLEGIRTISGSSAGAITAALLASGMNASEFKALSDKIDFISLLDSPVKEISLAQQMSGKAGKAIASVLGKLKLGRLGGFVQLLSNILPRLQSDAVPLERIVKQESRSSVLAQLKAHPELATRPDVATIRQRLEQGGGVTFGDLALLGRHIPAIKELNITGTGMFDGRPQMILFNASLTPDMEIARAAHISGSFPVVFSRPEEQHQPFLAQDEKLSLQDGGVMLNVPVPELIHPETRGATIAEHENLILKFESESGKPADRGTRKGAIKDWIVGATAGARSALQTRGLGGFADQIVTVPLKSEHGDFRGTFSGTLNFTMSDADKQHLQEQLADVVRQHLEGREISRKDYQFQDLESALLALSDRDFAAVAEERTPDVQATALFRQAAQEQLSVLVASVLNQDRSARLDLSGPLAQALDQLGTLADSPARQQWLAAQFNQADNPALARLLDTPSPTGRFAALDLGKEEASRRQVATVANNIIHEVIYPSLFRPGQPDSNVALLRKTEHALVGATTPAEVNEALRELADNYGARNKPWSKPLFSSTTVTQARSWMMRE
ncbi:patatin-like phospholipase family protein [Aeromonas salmonicida]|uniref:patatin-like phospholipase family protein n=1 Tax=Aeromonas salmonicida TaxID=645 RepID=UPI00232E1A53|nr:patatin-like phospholipase family protein [Aeromonas salmonicida]WCH23601.1 patatin-like phospholipase family protein [Aeromonas salmonicida]